jgi:hypothetical protein
MGSSSLAAAALVTIKTTRIAYARDARLAGLLAHDVLQHRHWLDDEKTRRCASNFGRNARLTRGIETGADRCGARLVDRRPSRSKRP